MNWKNEILFSLISLHIYIERTELNAWFHTKKNTTNEWSLCVYVCVYERKRIGVSRNNLQKGISSVTVQQIHNNRISSLNVLCTKVAMPYSFVGIYLRIWRRRKTCIRQRQCKLCRLLFTCMSSFAVFLYIAVPFRWRHHATIKQINTNHNSLGDRKNLYRWKDTYKTTAINGQNVIFTSVNLSKVKICLNHRK